MFGGIGVVVEVVDPGACPALHGADKIVDGGGVVAEFSEGVLQAGFADLVFVDIGEGVGDQFERDAVEGAVCEFDGKGFDMVGVPEGIFHLIEGVFMAMIVSLDVKGCAGCQQQDEEQGAIF